MVGRPRVPFGVLRPAYRAVAQGATAGSGMKPMLMEDGGRVVGYATPGFFGHGVSETNEQMVTLLRHVAAEMPPGAGRSFCPLRNADLFRLMLASGSRILRTMNLMSMGPYEEPSGGTWVPSICY